MNILISNDDGIRARGIYELAQALAGVPDVCVYICAPHTQRSASGHSISIGFPITVKEVEFDSAKLALEITGTPADCVKLGLLLLKEKGIEIDMVFSGINHGGNLGTDTLYSGTVSAALEGSFCGVPSVAVSVNSHQPISFGYATKLAVSTLKKCGGKLDCGTVLNINVPNLPDDEVKGVKYTRLGQREYTEWFTIKKNEEGENEYWYNGEAVVYENLPEDIDVIATQDGYATITPMHYDLTRHDFIDELRRWRIEE